MTSTYPLDLTEVLEGMYSLFYYLKAIGVSYGALDELLRVPAGVVKTWLMREADGFDPLIVIGCQNMTFLFTLIFCLVFRVWESMEKQVLARIDQDPEWDSQSAYWRGFRRDILSLGGVAGFRNEGEVTSVPSDLVRSNGLQPVRVGQILDSYFPVYGIKTEQEFYQKCDEYSGFRALAWLKEADHDR